MHYARIFDSPPPLTRTQVHARAHTHTLTHTHVRACDIKLVKKRFFDFSDRTERVDVGFGTVAHARTCFYTAMPSIPGEFSEGELYDAEMTASIRDVQFAPLTRFIHHYISDRTTCPPQQTSLYALGEICLAVTFGTAPTTQTPPIIVLRGFTLYNCDGVTRLLAPHQVEVSPYSAQPLP